MQKYNGLTTEQRAKAIGWGVMRPSGELSTAAERMRDYLPYMADTEDVEDIGVPLRVEKNALDVFMHAIGERLGPESEDREEWALRASERLVCFIHSIANEYLERMECGLSHERGDIEPFAVPSTMTLLELGVPGVKVIECAHRMGHDAPDVVLNRIRERMERHECDLPLEGRSPYIKACRVSHAAVEAIA